MKKSNIAFGVIMLFLLVPSSCTVERRIYNRGLNIEWSSRKHNSKKYSLEPKVKRETDYGESGINRQNLIKGGETVYVSALSDTLLNSSVNIQKEPLSELPSIGVIVSSEIPNDMKINHVFISDTIASDIMILKNGDEMKIKVIQIGLRDIKYKLSDSEKSPALSIRKSKVFMVKYANGNKAVLVNDGFGIAGFILGLLGLVLFFWPFIFGPAALILGLISLKRIKKHPGRYKGIGFVKACIILGSIETLFALLLGIYLVLDGMSFGGI